MKHVAGMLLVALLLPLMAFAQENDRFAQWEDDIAHFGALDREGKPPAGSILFLGSSSIRMWTTVADDMAPLPVINRGFGGSQIIDSIHFINNLVFPYAPPIIVFYAGDNDIAASKSAETVLADFTRFTEAVHARLPETIIFWVTIKPSPSRWNLWPEMDRANKLVDRFVTRTPKVGYLDVASAMLTGDGTVVDGIYLEDNLHMNADGYAIWTQLIKPRLEANF